MSYPYYTPVAGSAGRAGGGLLSSVASQMLSGHYNKQMQQSQQQAEVAMQKQLADQQQKRDLLLAQITDASSKGIPITDENGQPTEAFKSYTKSMTPEDQYQAIAKMKMAQAGADTSRANNANDFYNSDAGKQAVNNNLTATENAPAFVNEKTATIPLGMGDVAFQPSGGGLSLENGYNTLRGNTQTVQPNIYATKMIGNTPLEYANAPSAKITPASATMAITPSDISAVSSTSTTQGPPSPNGVSATPPLYDADKMNQVLQDLGQPQAPTQIGNSPDAILQYLQKNPSILQNQTQ